MSTLRLDTIQDQAGGNASTPDEIYNGRAKAWVNFDGTFGTSPFTIANGGIRDAFNVSSVTDDGTGQYTVNLTNALPDTNGAALTTATRTSDTVPVQNSGRILTTTTVKVRTRDNNSVNSDLDTVQLAVFR